MSAESITVYTKDNCVQCKALDRMFTKHGIYEAYEVTPVQLESLSEAEVEALREQGLGQAPVAVTPEGTFAGFRPDVVKALAARARQGAEVPVG